MTWAAATLGLAAAGCVSENVDAPDFEAGQGQDVAATDVAYPEGPYGFNEGSIIPDMEFLGYPDFVNRGAEMRVTKLSDFYNPTSTEVYGEDLAYYGLGQPKPKAIVMLISSVWCGPCNQEAGNVLPGEYAHYKPLGGQFVSVLIDGKDPGTPATVDELTAWSTRYQPAYTMTMDPSNYVMAFYEPAFPGNIIIRTSDMKIIRRVAGVPQADFWNTFTLVLSGQYQEPLDGAQ
jgi:hypothetical protein